MAVKVTVPLSTNISTSVPSSSSVTTNILSKNSAAKLDQLSDLNTEGVQNGYTLIYNATTAKWEVGNPATDISLSTIDGGSF